MNEQLLLENIRGVLIRLEETIIFNIIERAQFKHNAIVYKEGAFPAVVENDNLIGYFLYNTELLHSKVRRYQSPDEVPFFQDLPESKLPALSLHDNPLMVNTININEELREVYEQSLIPFICNDGDDGQYGSSAVCDVNLLQALSRRIHYGKFVAESKFQSEPELFTELIKRKAIAEIDDAITHREVELKILDRIEAKTGIYGADHDGLKSGNKVDPKAVRAVYEKWIIPLTKKVEVDYLLETRASNES